MAMTAVAAAMLAFALQQLPGAGGSVRGEIRSEESGVVVPGATVEVLDSRPRRATATDSIGTYRLHDVPAGRHTIRARRVGFAPFEMEVVVPAGREVVIDIALRMTPVVLAPVQVGARGRTAVADTVAALEGELTMAGVRAMQSSPGLSEIGLADAISRIPGQEPPDPSDVLYVRGTGADLKLVYLDGAPVYAPFPLGGLLEPFTPGLLSSAEVYLGGAPARYDGGLSYILDLRTRAARSGRVRTMGAVDLLSTRALVEVPMGGGGVLLSGRGVHDGRSWIAADGLPYGYREGLARVDVPLGALGGLSVTGFTNGERVWLDSVHVSNRAIQWGNSSASARYSGALGASTLEVTAAVGAFEARLPVAAASAALAEGSSLRTRFSADVASRLGPLALRYGASYEDQRQEYRARSAGGEGEWRPVGSRGEASEAGVYLDAGLQLARRLRLRGGLRADHFSLTDELLLAPRASATVMLTDRAALTLAAGRYHQYLRPPEVQVFAAGAEAPVLPAEPLALARATHVSLALDQEVGDGVRFGLEGFFKNYEGIPGGLSSEANASGMDLWVRRETGAWRGWLGYSLAWNWSTSDSDGGSRFAGRHLLSSGFSAPVGGPARIDLGVVYGAGLPYSAIPFGTSNLADAPMVAVPTYQTLSYSEAVSAGNAPLLGTPSRPYLRVDLGASGTWTPRLGNRLVEISPYLRLLNTLGQRDALFYRAPGEDGGSFRPLAALPLVPVVGMEWKF